MEEVYFSSNDSVTLINFPDLSNFMQRLFISESFEIFSIVCNHFLFGKNLNSASKRDKRAARVDLFLNIAKSNQLVPKQKLANIKLNKSAFALGLLFTDDRFKLYSADVIMTVVILIYSTQNNSTMNWENFESFLNIIETNFKIDKINPQKAFKSSYETLLRKFNLSHFNSFELVNIELKNKLNFIVIESRKLLLNPLCLYIKFIENVQFNLSNELNIDFLNNIAELIINKNNYIANNNSNYIDNTQHNNNDNNSQIKEINYNKNDSDAKHLLLKQPNYSES
jgi:hypothetical protein